MRQPEEEELAINLDFMNSLPQSDEASRLFAHCKEYTLTGQGEVCVFGTGIGVVTFFPANPGLAKSSLSPEADEAHDVLGSFLGSWEGPPRRMHARQNALGATNARGECR